MRLTKKQARNLKILSKMPIPKYHNNKVEYGGFLYDSKFECRIYQYFECLKAIGEVNRIVRQVPFHLGPKSNLIANFEVKFAGEDDVRYFKIEDMEDDNFLKKTKLVEKLYGVKIEIIKQEEF